MSAVTGIIAATVGPKTLDSVLRFGAFELDLKEGQLRKSGVRLKLRPQAVRVLALLATRSGDLVSREEIQKEIWSDDLVVDFDQGLNFCIRQIRAALGDDADTPRFIETVPRRGYRFLVPLQTEVLAPETQAESRPSTQAPGGTLKHGPRRLRLFVVAMVASLLAVGYFSFKDRWRAPEQPGSSDARIRSLAVLPLVNLSGDTTEEFFADGMTEALIGRFSTIRDLRVVSSTSAMQFKHTRKPVPVIGKELNVDAVMEGAVLRSDGRVRLTVRLIRTDMEKNLWSNVYERELRDVLTLQSELAQAIARQIEVRITGQEEGRLAAARAVAPEAYESYLKGRFHLNKGGRAAVEEGVRNFEAAIAIDRTFAPAYSGLALAYTAFGETATGISPVAEARPKAITAARRALELDPQLAEAHAALAYTQMQDWQWAEAEAGYRRALELDPNSVVALHNFGAWHAWRGRFEEGVELARRARDRDPLSLHRSTRLAWLLFHARRYDEAIRELRTVLAIERDHRGALWFLGFVLIEKLQFDEAIQVLERGASLSDRNPAELGPLSRAYARAGRRAEALRILDELKQRRREGYVPTGPFVNAYLGLGDHDQAFAWLNRACEERSNLILMLRTHPMYDPLRSDPRFATLLRRVGLERHD